MDPTRIHEWEHPALKLKKNDRIIVNNQECTFLDFHRPKMWPMKKLYIQALQHEKRIGFIVKLADPFQVSDQTLTFISPVEFENLHKENNKMCTLE